MSRRVVKSNLETLEHILETFYTSKVESDKYKKEADKYNKEIKKIMLENDLSEFPGTNFKASISTTEKSDFNDLQAIEILRKELDEDIFKDVVKTKEYIDFDVLESLAYNEVIDITILEPCTTPKPPTITLRVRPVKK